MKRILFILAPFILITAVAAGFYFSKSKKPSKTLPVINQKTNQVQEENTSEIVNAENTGVSQGSIDTGNQESTVNTKPEEPAPEGWIRYSYNENDVSLSFIYPEEWKIKDLTSGLTPDYGIVGPVDGHESFFAMEVYETMLTPKGNSDDAVWVGIDIKKRTGDFNLEDWKITGWRDAGFNLNSSTDLNEFTNRNGLSGYWISVFSTDHPYRKYFFFKGNYVLAINHWSNSWSMNGANEKCDEIIDSITFN